MTKEYFNQEKERLTRGLPDDRKMLANERHPDGHGTNRHHLTGDRLGLLRSDINLGRLTREEAQQLRDYYLKQLNLSTDLFQFPWESET